MTLRLHLSSPTDTGRIELRNGFVSWRRLSVADVEKLLDHFEGLDAEQLRLRFYGPVTRDTLRARYAAIDYAQAEIVGCEADGSIVALLEIMPDAHGASVEIALSVRSELQGAGLGHALLRLALEHGARAGAGRVELECLATNGPMRHLAEKMGFALRREDDVMLGCVAFEPARRRSARSGKARVRRRA